MKLNAPPSEIYLQYYGDGPTDNNPVSCEEVSWWHEMVFESDIKYTIANDQADCVSMPKSLTAENGAKALLMGEFHEIEMKCNYCGEPIDDEATYWEDEDGKFYCRERHLDEAESSSAPAGSVYLQNVRRTLETGLKAARTYPHDSAYIDLFTHALDELKRAGVSFPD